MRVLVAGLGDVGGRAAALLAADGHEVFGVRRSDAGGPAGVTMVRGDLNDPALVDELPANIETVLISVSADGRDTDRYRAAYVTGPATLLHALATRGNAVRRVVFTSSSAVYGQADGAWVNESSPTEPSSPTAQILLEAERAIAAAGFPSTIVRLTGIYGAGRSTRLVDMVRRGEAFIGTTPAWTNRIHAADAGAACAVLLTTRDAPPIVIGTDDEPAERAAVFQWLADRLGVDGPIVDDARGSDRGSKRCSNTLLRSLGWEPSYPSFRDGYAEMT
jgi:nucleoside-diphosphate-sugar epimerase